MRKLFLAGIICLCLLIPSFSQAADKPIILDLGEFSLNEKFDEVPVQDGSGIYPMGFQYAGICGSNCLLLVVFSSSPLQPGGYRPLFKSGGSYVLKVYTTFDGNYVKYTVKQTVNGNTVTVTKEVF